jgi:multidrug resistance efflux pump
MFFLGEIPPVAREKSFLRNYPLSSSFLLSTLTAAASAAAQFDCLIEPTQWRPPKTAESKIEFSKRKFQRRREMHDKNFEMHDKNFMSGQERDEAESEMKLAESQLQLANENKQMAKLEWQQQSSLLNLRTIGSPFDGVVVNQFLYPGEIVEPGGQKKAILKLAQLDPLRVHVILPMAVFGKIKPGMSVDVNPEAPIGGRYVGKVKIVDKLVDAASGMLGVFLEIVNPKLEVPAGVKCRAEFPIGAETPKAGKPEPDKPLKPGVTLDQKAKQTS